MIERLLYPASAVVMSLVLFALVLQADDTPRALVAAVGMLAVLMLTYQLLRCFRQTTVLVHVLGVLLILSVLLGAAATSVNAINHAPPNPVLWAVLAHRLACIVVAVMWPRWLTRTTAPYRRPILG